METAECSKLATATKLISCGTRSVRSLAFPVTNIPFEGSGNEIISEIASALFFGNQDSRREKAATSGLLRRRLQRGLQWWHGGGVAAWNRATAAMTQYVELERPVPGCSWYL